MRYLTPDDVHNVAFAKPSIGRRGYNEDQVDSFIDDVEATLRDLYARLARYEGTAPAPQAPLPERPEDRGFRSF
ncbi:DivIVA domain-containing protein [Tsukamurella spumae]|uniref:DivIVA domain-containing protein n=1 Tax=Tsukamurella spumae TaxID=44753 RepID=A0A846X783_9ACTN|nr:DivIVA domain-containing protein [Tsukamurella spumae]NKY20052.1 DivIVA domain-containing protein [Tsukamurella spumae]